jgi:hypothetical protein
MESQQKKFLLFFNIFDNLYYYFQSYLHSSSRKINFKLFSKENKFLTAVKDEIFQEYISKV